MTLQGRRVRPEEDGLFPHTLEAGDYCFWEGEWYGQTPNGLLAGLRQHQVTEHEDGSITVAPSILVRQGEGGPSWHGFLERGVWRDCA